MSRNVDGVNVALIASNGRHNDTPSRLNSETDHHLHNFPCIVVTDAEPGTKSTSSYCTYVLMSAVI